MNYAFKMISHPTNSQSSTVSQSYTSSRSWSFLKRSFESWISRHSCNLYLQGIQNRYLMSSNHAVIFAMYQKQSCLWHTKLQQTYFCILLLDSEPHPVSASAVIRLPSNLSLILFEEIISSWLKFNVWHMQDLLLLLIHIKLFLSHVSETY